MGKRVWAILACFGLLSGALFAAEGVGKAPASAGARLLGPDATVSLITEDPGREVYLAFGHSAIRVRDKANGIDTLFNYGVFSESSLSDPRFIFRFVKGELDYMVYPFPFADDLDFDLQTEGRAWREQVLDLSPQEKESLYSFLRWNCEEANRVYRYDFVKDNCATRARDALERSVAGGIAFPPLESGTVSYRSLIDECLERRPGWRFLIDLALGSAADRKIDVRQAMFQPASMMAAFGGATVVRGGKTESLVSETRTIVDPPSPPSRAPRSFDPAAVLWPAAIALLLLTAYQLFRRSRGRGRCAADRAMAAFDTLFFFMTGALGLLVGYLSLLSTHYAAKGNFNILWLLPTNLILAFLIAPSRKSRILSAYWLLTAVLCLSTLLLWGLLPQRLNPSFIPLQLIILGRALWIFREKAWPPEKALPETLPAPDSEMAPLPPSDVEPNN